MSQHSRYFFIACPGCNFRMSSFAFLANLNSLKSLKLRLGGVGNSFVQASQSQKKPYSLRSFSWRSAFGCFTKLALRYVRNRSNLYEKQEIREKKKKKQLTCSNRTVGRLFGSDDKHCRRLCLQHKS